MELTWRIELTVWIVLRDRQLSGWHHPLAVATKQTRADRGRTRGKEVVTKLVAELVQARRSAGLSQKQLASLAGWSQAGVSRFEHLENITEISFIEVAIAASVLGKELGANLYPLGEPIRDRGHQALIGRFRGLLSKAWNVVAELPLPGVGDLRAWDLVLRVTRCVVGVEAETRLRDVQSFVRRIRQRERDGGVDAIVIVLAESTHNRAILPQLLEALGAGYETSPRQLLAALREGTPLAGGGVVLL